MWKTTKNLCSNAGIVLRNAFYREIVVGKVKCATNFNHHSKTSIKAHGKITRQAFLRYNEDENYEYSLLHEHASHAKNKLCAETRVWSWKIELDRESEEEINLSLDNINQSLNNEAIRRMK